VGREVTRASVGDHVILFPTPTCGSCRFCNDGRSYLCDLNAYVATGRSPDGSYRFHLDGQGLGAYAQLGTFSQTLTVSELQVLVIEKDVPLDVACLIGCGVTTGYGSAVKVAKVQPGETVVVVGAGGVGISAVQGARIAGASTIVAVDPVELKRTTALALGATHAARSMEDGRHLVSELTRNVMADKVIVTLSLLKGDMFEALADLTAKGGTIAVTSVSPSTERSLSMPLSPFFLSNKSLVGTVFGLVNPLVDMPRMLDHYRAGSLKLDEMVTATYPLEQLNQGYADLHAGVNIRGVVRF